MSGSPSPPPGGSGAFLTPQRPISFAVNIDGPPGPDADPVIETVKRKMPYDGAVTEVFIDIPDGVHSRAGFQIWDEARGRKIFPFNDETEYAAFNDVQDWWDVSFPVLDKDEVHVRYINEDDQTTGHLLKVWMLVAHRDGLPVSPEEMAGREGITLDS